MKMGEKVTVKLDQSHDCQCFIVDILDESVAIVENDKGYHDTAIYEHGEWWAVGKWNIHDELKLPH